MQTQNSWYCTIILNVILVIAGISVSHPITSLNPVTPVIKRIYNQTYLERYGEPMPDSAWIPLLSVTMSMIFIGACIGSLSVKTLLSRFTRKQLLNVTHIMHIVANTIIAVGVSVWGSYEAFIAGRLIVGLSMGLGLGVYGIVVNELCVPHKRSLYAGLLGTWYIIGSLVGVLIGWSKMLGTDELWLGVILFGPLVSILYIVCSYWITDTPVQMMISHGADATAKVLGKLRTGHGTEIAEEMKKLAGDDEDPIKKYSADLIPAQIREVLKPPQYRKHFFGVVIVYSHVMACGLSNILFFSDLTFINAGLDPDVVTIGTIVIYVIGSIVSAISVFAMGRLDPRILSLIGGMIMIFGDVLTTASLALKEIPAMPIVTVVSMCIFFLGFSILNMTAYVIIQAICIDRTRAISMTVATMGFWFFAWFVGFISPYLDKTVGPYAYMVWMTISIAVWIYTYFCVPNVAGKTEDEIQDFYKISQ